MKAINSIMQFALKHAFPGGAIVLTITSFASYALGLLRDRMFAQTFGASAQLDAYNASFVIPDLLLNIFVAGALSAAFIPLFSGLLRAQQSHKAHELARSVITSALLVIFITGFFVFAFAPMLTAFVAPGFSAAQKDLLANLMRIMILSPLIFAASNALGSMLVSYRRMLWFGLSPAFYNLGIIGGTLLLAPAFGIYGVAWGTVGGAFLHLGVRMWGMRGLGFRFRPQITWSSDLSKILGLMLPKMFGHPVEMMIFWGFTIIASTLGEGSIATLNFARNFQSVPVSLFGISFALAAFPMLAEAASARNYTDFRAHFSKALRGILLLTGASALFIFFFREFIIQFFLGGGAFGREDILATAAVLGVFTLSIPLESAGHLLARAFYALQNTFIPVSLSILSLLIAVGLGWILAPRVGVSGLAIAFTVGSFVKIVILSVILHRKMK